MNTHNNPNCQCKEPGQHAPVVGNSIIRSGLDFGEAIRLLKSGKRVARAGWNGKGMWLAYCPGYPDGVPANVAGAHAMRVPLGTPIKVLPYIAMKTADNAMVPWLASQTDMLAEDWMEVAS